MSKKSGNASKAILNVVAEQIRTNNPPETKENYIRLKLAGYSDAEAHELIGQVVMAEVVEVMQQGEVFNHERFVARLKKLPNSFV